MKDTSSLSQVFIFLFLLEACTKDKATDQPFAIPVVDYRDTYTGNYNCTRLCTFWSISQPQTETTFYSAINISVTKHPVLTNSLIVENDTIPIDSAGTFSGFYNPPAYHNYSIVFRSDSVFINSFSGGLGGGTTCNTIGKK